MSKAVFPDGVDGLTAAAAKVLEKAVRRNLSITVAESCTGGLLASLLTDVEGSSGCFERGFVVYSNEAKSEMLGVDRMEIERHGAVSGEIAVAMAIGALGRSHADLAVSITGFAGPAGKGDEQGLVHLAACSGSAPVIHRECHFGSGGRDRTRHLAIQAALEMLDELLEAAGKEADVAKNTKARGVADELVGKAKRALGELTARPDIVLDGEDQELRGRKEQAVADRRPRKLQ